REKSTRGTAGTSARPDDTKTKPEKSTIDRREYRCMAGRLGGREGNLILPRRQNGSTIRWARRPLFLGRAWAQVQRLECPHVVALAGPKAFQPQVQQARRVRLAPRFLDARHVRG